MNNYKNRFEDIETVEDYYKFKAQNDPTLLNITNQSMTSFRGSQYLRQQDVNSMGSRPENGKYRSQAVAQKYNQNQGTFRDIKPNPGYGGNNDWNLGNIDQHQSDFDFPVYKGKGDEKMEGSMYDMNRQSRLNDFSKIEPIPHVNDDTVEQSLMHFLMSKKKSPRNENASSISSWNQGNGGRPNKEDYYNNKVQGGSHNGNSYNNRADRMPERSIQGNAPNQQRLNEGEAQYRQNPNGPSRYEGSVNSRSNGQDFSGSNVLVTDPKIRLLLNDVNSLIEKAEGKNYDRGGNINIPGAEKNYGSNKGSNRSSSLVDKYTKGDPGLDRGEGGGRNYVDNSSVRAYLKSLESKIDVVKTEDKKEASKDSASNNSSNNSSSISNAKSDSNASNTKFSPAGRKESEKVAPGGQRGSCPQQEPQKSNQNVNSNSNQSKGGLSSGVEALKQRAKFPVKKKRSKKRKDLDVIEDNNSSEENSSEDNSSRSENEEEVGSESSSDRSTNKRKQPGQKKETKKEKKKKHKQAEVNAKSKNSKRWESKKHRNSSSQSETEEGSDEDKSSSNDLTNEELTDSDNGKKGRNLKRGKAEKKNRKRKEHSEEDEDNIEFEEVQTVEDEDFEEDSSLRRAKRDKSKRKKDQSKIESKKEKKKERREGSKKGYEENEDEEYFRESKKLAVANRRNIGVYIKEKKKRKEKKKDAKRDRNPSIDKSTISQKAKEQDISKIGAKQKGVAFIDESLTPITVKTGLLELDEGIQGTSPFQIEDNRGTNQQRLSLKKSSSELSMFSGSVSTLFSNNKSFINDMSCLKGLDKEKADLYLRKKYGPEAQQKIEAEQASKNLKTIEGAEILCVDCEEYINIDEVDEHSKVCFKALGKEKRESNRQTCEEKYEASDDKTKLTMNNEKLRKITEMLRKKIGKMHLEDPVNAEPIFNYCTMLIRCTDQIIVRNSSEEITELVRNIKDVNIFNKRLYELHNKYSKMVLNLSLRIKQLAKLKIPLIDGEFTWEQAKEMTKLSATMVLNLGGPNQSQMINQFKKNNKSGNESGMESILGLRTSEINPDSDKKINKSFVPINTSQTVNSKHSKTAELNSSQISSLNTSVHQASRARPEPLKTNSKIPRSPVIQRVSGNAAERSESKHDNKNPNEELESSQSSHNLSSASANVKRYKIKNPQQNLLIKRDNSVNSGLRLNQNMSNKINPVAGESKMNTSSTNSFLNESDISGIFKEPLLPGAMHINNSIGKLKGKENLFNFKKSIAGDLSVDAGDPQTKANLPIKPNSNDVSINKGAPSNAAEMRRAQQDKKKKFFDLAVKIKLDLPQNHPARTVLVNDLYDRAVNEKILETSWADYIFSHYNGIKC